MSAEKRKTNYISKETRDAIKRFLTTNVSHSEVSGNKLLNTHADNIEH